MDFDWKKALRELAPAIGGAVSGPFVPLVQAGLSVASEVIFGKAGATEDEVKAAIEKGLPPEAVAALKQADQNFRVEMRRLDLEDRKLDIEEEKVSAGDRTSARDMQKAALQQDDRVAKRFVYEYATFVTGVAFIYIFSITFFAIPEKNIRFADTILGFLLGTLVAAVINFFFGSSSGSDHKTSIMANLIDRIKGD